MIFQHLYAFKIMSKSVLRFNLYHSIYQILCLDTHNLFEFFFLRPTYFSILDISMHLHLLSSLEGHKPTKHFEEDAAKCPHVNRKPLIFSLYDFRTLVIDRAHKGKSPLQPLILRLLIIILFIMSLINFSSITKINDFDIIVLIHHNVLRLEISMHYSLLLYVLLKINQLSKY